MRKLLLITPFLLFFISTIDAQIELKGNPLGLIFGTPDISVEYLVAENIGVEAANVFVYGNVFGSGLLDNDLRLRKSGYQIKLMGKYYINPVEAGDGLFFGVFGGPRRLKVTGNSSAYGYDPGYVQTSFTIGGMVGYKYLIDGGFFFEAQVGLQYGIGGNLDLSSVLNSDVSIPSINMHRRLLVGYRFGNESRK